MIIVAPSRTSDSFYENFTEIILVFVVLDEFASPAIFVCCSKASGCLQLRNACMLGKFDNNNFSW